MISDLQRLMRPLARRVSNMVARGVVKLVDDSQKMQIVQLMVGPDEVRDRVERVQQYGLTSVPDVDAEAVVLFVGGGRDHGLVVAVDDRRYRVKGLQAGEVCLYSKAGQSILLKGDGTIEIGGGTMQPAALGQDVRDELDDLRAKFAAHTHAVATTGTAAAQTGTAAPTGTALLPPKAVKSATVKVKI